MTKTQRRHRLSFSRALAGSLGVFAAVAACSDGVPLGGPHGDRGTSLVAPNEGNSSSSSVSTSSSIASSGSVGTSSGAPKGDGGGGTSGGTEGGAASGTGPTWTAIFSSYMTDCKTCHTQCTSAKSTFLWLRSQAYITGANPALVSTSESCLSWYGGNMPPGGGDNAAAVADMNAWAAGGALDN